MIMADPAEQRKQSLREPDAHALLFRIVATTGHFGSWAAPPTGLLVLQDSGAAQAANIVLMVGLAALGAAAEPAAADLFLAGSRTHVLPLNGIFRARTP